STYPTKTWGGAGDGGFVVSNDPDLLHRVRRLANHGMRGPHDHIEVCDTTGRNSRLDVIQAAILLAHATNLGARVHRRRQIARRYDLDLPPSTRPLPRDDGHPVQHYVVRVPHRDDVRSKLRDLGVHTAVYYPMGLHRQPALQEHAILTECPVADMLCEQLLALPVHAGLSDTQVGKIISAMWSCTT
ncbi:MAG: UDP-2-acetamido-2-deoxy-ribo-hexuluronate aminotransferase, partial [Kiritimatiellia bacterium]